uniref:Uncharacterized protein n=1 Tax=Rhizophora mucronata TaxID=61149 RepID=A0A2P2QFT9_RHIMU
MSKWMQLYKPKNDRQQGYSHSFLKLNFQNYTYS